jgi:GT2 family glycosyltransferase/ubiquinone/menaquinone biosynthesis C-methylase UbiE
MPGSRPLLSIIIPHHAGSEILIDCLEALKRQSVDFDTETILVDNGSTDGSVARAQEHCPDLRVVRLEENHGYARGCNRGIEVARGRYVLLLNDDTEVDPDCLRELVRVAEADPGLGACQPKIRSLREPSKFEYSGAAGGLMDVYGYPFSRGRLMGHVEVDDGQYDDAVEVFWASGVCMLIRRAVLEEVGAFDEIFFAYMEEIDLCWRIHLAGHRIAYVPSSVVYHIGAYSLERHNTRRMYLNHRNSMIMVVKNYSVRSLLWVLPVKAFLEFFIFAGALARNVRRSQAVLWSFGWLLANVPTVLRLRRRTQRLRRVQDASIFRLLYRGMAPIWYFLFGIRHVSDLPDIDVVLHLPYRGAGSPARNEAIQPRQRNFLDAYLDQAPVSLALMRAIECRHLAALPFERPILDVGCGNGTFARVLFNGMTLDAGVDQNPREIERARATGCYQELEVSRIEDMPFTSERFATVYSNCVLEHVADIETALGEIHRVLKPGGALYMTVPNPRCVTFLLWRQAFRRLGLVGLADWYSNLTHHEPYMPRRATRIQDALLPTAFLSVLSKRLLGRTLVFPRVHRVKVRAYRRLFHSAYEERADEGSATMLVARKVGRTSQRSQSP